MVQLYARNSQQAEIIHRHVVSPGWSHTWATMGCPAFWLEGLKSALTQENHGAEFCKLSLDEISIIPGVSPALRRPRGLNSALPKSCQTLMLLLHSCVVGSLTMLKA